MTKIQSVSERPVGSADFSLSVPSKSNGPSILDQADSFQEKAVLTTLLALDKASFISPFRWFLPTASENGQKLEGGVVGCGSESTNFIPQESSGTDKGNAVPEETPIPPMAPPPECSEGDKQFFYSGNNNTKDVGICHPGVKECFQSQWVVTTPEVVPQKEICNGKDNDCNGTLKIFGQLGDPKRLESSWLHYAFSAIWTGQEFAVLYHTPDFNTSPTVLSALALVRADAQGNQIGAEQILWEDPAKIVNNQSIIWTGTNYAVAWSDYDDPYLYPGDERYNLPARTQWMQLDNEGRVVEDSMIPIASNLDTPSLPVEFNTHIFYAREEYGIFFGELGSDYWDGISVDYPLYLARFDSQGNSIGNSFMAVNTAVNPPQYSRNIFWTGAEYGYVGCNDDSCFLTRLDHEGNTLGEAKRLFDGNFPHHLPNPVIWTGNQYAATWIYENHGEESVVFGQFDAQGNSIGDIVSTPIPVPSLELESLYLTWAESEYGIAWTENDGQEVKYFLMRLDSTGIQIGEIAEFNDSFSMGDDHGGSPVGVERLFWTGSSYAVLSIGNSFNGILTFLGLCK